MYRGQVDRVGPFEPVNAVSLPFLMEQGKRIFIDGFHSLYKIGTVISPHGANKWEICGNGLARHAFHPKIIINK